MNPWTIICLNIGRMYGRVRAPIHAWPLPGPRQAGLQRDLVSCVTRYLGWGGCTAVAFVLCMTNKESVFLAWQNICIRVGGNHLAMQMLSECQPSLKLL